MPKPLPMVMTTTDHDHISVYELSDTQAVIEIRHRSKALLTASEAERLARVLIAWAEYVRANQP